MPELPEVEVLVRHLRPLLGGRTIRSVQVRRAKVVGPASTRHFAKTLRRSRQAIKVRLLDQSLLAGVGNIYASEALFRAGIAHTLPARRLTAAQAQRLWRAVRAVLREAIACGSTVPLNYAGQGKPDGLFYFGKAPGAPDYYEERLRVYDRAGKPCPECGTAIKRRVQAARSTYYCPMCQSEAQIRKPKPEGRSPKSEEGLTRWASGLLWGGDLFAFRISEFAASN